MRSPSRNSLWAAAALAGIVALALCFWRPGPGKAGRAKNGLPGIESSKASEAASPDASTSAGDAARMISNAATALKAASDAEAARRVVTALRRELVTLPPDAAAATIRGFLDSREDVPTRLEFKVGADGFLNGAPSLRVFLLDSLGQVDPAAAAAYAGHILGSRESSEEWAVSLRNYAVARRTPAGTAFLQDKLRQMLRHEPWRNKPSASFLEAFDVAVHVGGTGLLPELTELLRQQDNRAVAHAAYLALDRLVIREPAAVLEVLQRQPEMMTGREGTRANYFA